MHYCEVCDADPCIAYWSCINGLTTALERVYYACLPVAQERSQCNGGCLAAFRGTVDLLSTVWLTIVELQAKT